MDTSTLVTAGIVLAERSIRSASRRLGRPVASVAAALARLQNALAVDLAYRAGSSLTLTLEADRLASALTALRLLVEEMIAPALDGEARTRAAGSVEISLEALRRFVEVVRIGSIRSAARQLAMGQPQLTRQLRRLETLCGADLLERASDGCHPTEAGRRVHDVAVRILTGWGELVVTAPRGARRAAHTVHLGSIVPLGHESRIALQLADVVARWKASRRLQHLSLKSTTAEELARELKAGDLDLAILDCDPTPLGLEGVCFQRSRTAIVGAPGFHVGRATADVLLDKPVAVPSLRSGLRRIVNDIVAEVRSAPDRTPDNFTEIDSISVIFNLVTRYGFVSVLPVSSFGVVGQVLDVIELPERFDLRLWLAWLPGRPVGPAAGEILGYMGEFAMGEFGGAT